MTIFDQLAESHHQHSFASDNWAGAHPDVLAALSLINDGYQHAYGEDPVTAMAQQHLQELFGGPAAISFVTNGTGANLLALQSLLRRYEAVICPATAHINTDECGSCERAGIKLLTVPTTDGKLTPDLLTAYIRHIGDPHRSQPGAISISQVTERGTCYQPAEIAALADIAHQHQLYLHMDGARLAQAAAYLGVSPREFTSDVGVDAISFGGTKNGILYGEAVVLLGEAATRFGSDLPYLRKSSGQLLSKMRFVAAQFLALLDGDRWLHLAQHSVDMAAALATAVRSIDGITITQPVESNAIFAQVRPHIIQAVVAEFPFYVLDEDTSEVRWMTSWCTTPADVEAFVNALKAAAA